MALPSAGYDSATITNPSSAVTDFSLLIDLSRMSSSWWSDVNSSDGTRGRVCKSDGTTELACDWIDFDNTAETGLLRVKWSGTLASSGTQTIRIFAPNTRNNTVGASDTYGSDNAYDASTWAYWPMSSDGDGRTSNGRDLRAENGLTFGGVSGLIGDATQFTSGSDHADTEGYTFDYTAEFTMMALAKHDTETSDQGIFGSRDDSGYQVWRDEYSSPDRYAIYSGIAYGTTDPGTTWRHVACSNDNSSSFKLYVDGSVEATTSTIPTQADDEITIGRAGGTKFMDGLIQHVIIANTERSGDWIAEEESQISDNATFWGSWSWTAGGGGVAPTGNLSGPFGGPMIGAL